MKMKSNDESREREGNDVDLTKWLVKVDCDTRRFSQSTMWD
jgi:hypothetical protein